MRVLLSVNDFTCRVSELGVLYLVFITETVRSCSTMYWTLQTDLEYVTVIEFVSH